MVTCKKCLSEKTVKNGMIRRKQRYVCRECDYIFTESDKRTNDRVIAKKAMCTILYSLSKASFNMLSHIFDTWPSLVYRWIVETGAKMPASEEIGEIKEKFDEMWHFVGSKKQALDPKSHWSWQAESCGLGAWASWYCNLQKTLRQSQTFRELYLLYWRLGCFFESVAQRAPCYW